MSVLSRPAILLTTASMAVGLLVAPGPAHAADISTTLTSAEMKAAMQTVASATATAAATGWKQTRTGHAATPSGSQWPYTFTLTYDAQHHRLRHVMDAEPDPEEEYLVAEGIGIYQAVNAAADRAALGMIGRPEIGYQFIADKTASLADLTGQGSGSPAGFASSFPMRATRIVHDDGSTDYRIASNPLLTTLHVNAAAVLTGYDSVRIDGQDRYEAATQYSYAPQTVNLPAAAVTIDARQLYVGCMYRDMAQRVSDAVSNGVRKAPQGAKLTVAALRRSVRQEAAYVNKFIQVEGLVKVQDVTSGVRVYATNPWTKKTTATTVTVFGKKIVTKKA